MPLGVRRASYGFVNARGVGDGVSIPRLSVRARITSDFKLLRDDLLSTDDQRDLSIRKCADRRKGLRDLVESFRGRWIEVRDVGEARRVRFTRRHVA